MVRRRDRVRVERGETGIYEVHRSGSRAEALALLRGREVREERLYIIVETPEGNVGRDMIMLFDERDGSCIELGERPALPAPVPAAGFCARCGYPVLPLPAPRPDGAGSYLALQDLARDGCGYRCRTCANLGCAACYLAIRPTRGDDGVLDLRCWLCPGGTEPFHR